MTNVITFDVVRARDKGNFNLNRSNNCVAQVLLVKLYVSCHLFVSLNHHFEVAPPCRRFSTLHSRLHETQISLKKGSALHCSNKEGKFTAFQWRAGHLKFTSWTYLVCRLQVGRRVGHCASKAEKQATPSKSTTRAVRVVTEKLSSHG